MNLTDTGSEEVNKTVSFGKGPEQEFVRNASSWVPNWGTLIEEVHLERSKEFVEQYLKEQAEFKHLKDEEHEANLVSMIIKAHVANASVALCAASKYRACTYQKFLLDQFLMPLSFFFCEI